MQKMQNLQKMQKVNKINNREFTIFIDQQFYFVATGGNVTLVASANNKNYELLD